MRVSWLLLFPVPAMAVNLFEIRQSGNQNRVFYPPEDGSSDAIPNFAVHAGDTLNITWETTYPRVDLHIVASAPHSNFTVTPYYNPGLPSASYFTYVLQPHDYYINDSSIGIQAFFQ